MGCGCGRPPARSAANGVGGAVGCATWAIVRAGGLGGLLAQQLVATGERVVDVQARTGRELAWERHSRSLRPANDLGINESCLRNWWSRSISSPGDREV